MKKAFFLFLIGSTMISCGNNQFLKQKYTDLKSPKTEKYNSTNSDKVYQEFQDLSKEEEESTESPYLNSSSENKSSIQDNFIQSNQEPIINDDDVDEIEMHVNTTSSEKDKRSCTNNKSNSASVPPDEDDELNDEQRKNRRILIIVFTSLSLVFGILGILTFFGALLSVTGINSLIALGILVLCFLCGIIAVAYSLDLSKKRRNTADLVISIIGSSFPWVVMAIGSIWATIIFFDIIS